MGAEPGLTEAALGDGATVLLMGQGDLWEDALVEALTRHGVFVEHVAADAVVTAAVAAAPDLIVLLGDATGEQSGRILRELATAQTTSIVPVVLLARDDALDERLRAFRHGAVAVVPRSSSVDEMATRICSLIREIPERRGEAIGEMGEATLDEFVDVVSRELRSGILSVKSSQRDDTLVRMVLGKGRDVARIVDEFVSRVQPLVKSAEPVRYEFHEQAPGTLEQLDAGSPRREAREGDIRDMRIVLADDDPGRADEVAQALRAQGASVAVVRPDDIDVERVQHLDPEVIILGEEQAEAPGVDVLHRTRQHVRLRWARLLVVRWQDVWVGPTKVSTLSRLIERLVQLGEPERELRRRMASGQPFDTRIEITGPARMLRVLSTTNRPLRAISTSLRGRLVVDAAEGLIVGASGRSATEPALEGDKAIAAMLVLTSARVHVEPVSRPAVANLMATVDVALTRATSEIASLPNGWNTNPSIAPPRLTTRLTVASSAPAPVPV
ncbi:MAG: hypothetical protein IT379_20915, partial [Deltaproteobacteria bacterium]|nr:hypothetical protein [Deltaproteobacteria bacterium]